ncbi:AraC-like DNA-binding protein [Lipingzhangella halophila]|uniref:AraC-like DNA-binding protein n=2 Tax=Lipingzhangella halophila TaxID=1783352 RepID=A0A7W7RJ13_9ACTN|nr:AraC-like DNA-binding protein [Lipingzhangella halophila]
MQAAGTTPRELIREERLVLARDRLTIQAYRGTPIFELAHRTGFGSASAFSTAFRQRFGVTPRELRRAHCAETDAGDLTRCLGARPPPRR